MESKKVVYDAKLFDIPDFKGLYKITKDGRVWNCMKEQWQPSRVRSHLHDYYAKVKGCVGIDKQDFLCIRMVKDKKWSVVNIHRLMAKTFLENKHGYKYVHHIDFDRTNNKIDNLMWAEKPIVKKKKLFVKKPRIWGDPIST
jgi:hypothetical protein